jgi:hypothetical protein
VLLLSPKQTTSNGITLTGIFVSSLWRKKLNPETICAHHIHTSSDKGQGTRDKVPAGLMKGRKNTLEAHPPHVKKPYTVKRLCGTT